MIIEKDRNDFYMLNWLDTYMQGHKGFIAGGCFKNIFNNEKIKDLDIFFNNKIDYENAVMYFDSMTENYEGVDKSKVEYILYYQNPKVTAYKNLRTGICVELCKAIFGTAKEILNQFDFSITKFAYFKKEITDEFESESHIEYYIAYEEKFFEHLHLKRLVIDDKIPFPISTFERMIRYIGYGYKPCKETKMKIIKAIHDTAEKQIEISESLYDGMD